MRSLSIPMLLAVFLFAGCVSMVTPREVTFDEQVLSSWDGWVSADLSPKTDLWWRRWTWKEWTRIDKDNDGRVDWIRRHFRDESPGWLSAIDEEWEDSDGDGYIDRHCFRTEDGTKHRVTKVRIKAPVAPEGVK